MRSMLIFMLGLLVASQAVQAVQVSPYLHRQLNQAYEQLEQQPVKAVAQLQALLDSQKLDNYSRSLSLRLLAHGLLALDRDADAITALHSVLRENALEPAVLQSVRANLGQLLLSQQQYADAQQILQQWLSHDNGATPQARAKVAALLGSTLFYQDQFEAALSYFEQAVASDIDASETGDSAWRRSVQRMRLSTLLQLKRYVAVQQLVKRLLADEPDNTDYWRILTASHLQLEQYEQALNAFELSYQAGLLTAAETLQLASLQIAQGVPGKAARLLEQQLKTPLPALQLRWYQLQGDAWLRAKEPEKAVASYKQGLAASLEGTLELKLANTYLDQQQWSQASFYFQAAQRKGQALKPAEYLRLGIAFLKNNETKQAIATFEAIEPGAYHKQAAEWLSYARRLSGLADRSEEKTI